MGSLFFIAEFIHNETASVLVKALCL